MPDEPVVDEGNQHTAGPHAPADTTEPTKQRRRGSADFERREQSGDTQGVSRAEEFLWGDSFWAAGYLAETVGQVDEEIIRKYIENQDKAG